MSQYFIAFVYSLKEAQGHIFREKNKYQNFLRLRLTVVHYYKQIYIIPNFFYYANFPMRMWILFSKQCYFINFWQRIKVMF